MRKLDTSILNRLARFLGLVPSYTLQDAFEDGREAARKARKASEVIQYRCYICQKDKVDEKMQVCYAPPEHLTHPESCCKSCWNMTGETPFFTCNLCHEGSPYHEMERLTPDVWICRTCDTKARQIGCTACDKKVDRTLIVWRDQSPICKVCAEKPITAKVAKVLNEYNLVLNVGKAHGVQAQMRFNVHNLDADTGEVIDPDTGESLGMLGYPYQKVEIYRVYEKFAVAVCCEELPESRQFGKRTRLLMPPESIYIPLSSHIKVGSHAESIKGATDAS